MGFETIRNICRVTRVISHRPDVIFQALAPILYISVQKEFLSLETYVIFFSDL